MILRDGIEIYCGDSIEVMNGIGPVDAIFADLPYGTTSNKWDAVIPFADLWGQYNRLSRGAVVLNASQPFTSALVMSNPKSFKHEWVWIKNRGSNFANTVREPMKEHESVLVFSPSGRWTYNKQMQERTGGGVSLIGKTQNRSTRSENYGAVADYTSVLPELRVPSSWQKFNTEVGLHPTQKPVPLMEYLIKTYTNEGDIILDNVMGSGTTAIAAINLNRRFIGIERDEKYFGVAKERIEQHLQRLL